jgi:hypothetical protein
MMEDSTFQGWTQPLPPGVMGVPDGHMLPGPPGKGYVGEMRISTRADADSIAYAAKYWSRRDSDHFEVTGRGGAMPTEWSNAGGPSRRALCDPRF